jgi:RNA polymerase sigma-70 factor (ECF subfamily)
LLSSPQTVEVQKLFLRHYSALRAFVFSILPDSACADDIVQETFLVVTEHADDFQLGSNFFAWVCEIARRRILSERRKFARQSLHQDVVELLLESIPEQAFNRRKLDILSGCLDRLPPRLQELVKLRHLTGKRSSEIAQAATRSVNSVKVALSKARTLLRGCIERELRREGGL